MNNHNNEVLVPMTPQQYEYWKKGLFKVEVEMRGELDKLKHEKNEYSKKCDYISEDYNKIKMMVQSDPKFGLKISFDDSLKKSKDTEYIVLSDLELEGNFFDFQKIFEFMDSNEHPFRRYKINDLTSILKHGVAIGLNNALNDDNLVKRLNDIHNSLQVTEGLEMIKEGKEMRDKYIKLEELFNRLPKWISNIIYNIWG